MSRTITLVVVLVALFGLAAVGYVSAQDAGTPTVAAADCGSPVASPVASGSPETVAGRNGQVLLASPVVSSACASPSAAGQPATPST